MLTLCTRLWEGGRGLGALGLWGAGHGAWDPVSREAPPGAGPAVPSCASCRPRRSAPTHSFRFPCASLVGAGRGGNRRAPWARHSLRLPRAASGASRHLAELRLRWWGSQPGIPRSVPSPDGFFLSQPQDQITITGYEKNTEAARDAILKIVGELEQMVSEDVPLDHRVHARIIGARGKAIRKIMDEFKVGPGQT